MGISVTNSSLETGISRRNSLFLCSGGSWRLSPVLSIIRVWLHHIHRDVSLVSKLYCPYDITYHGIDKILANSYEFTRHTPYWEVLVVSKRTSSSGDRFSFLTALKKMKTELSLPSASINPPFLAAPTRQTLRFSAGNLCWSSLGTVAVSLKFPALHCCWILDSYENK